MTPEAKTSSTNWSAKVTRESNALDLEPGIFTWRDPKKIALSLKQSADASSRRKSKPFSSAMSMLVFYINRAGKNLDDHRAIFEQAKIELRKFHLTDVYQQGILIPVSTGNHVYRLYL